MKKVSRESALTLVELLVLIAVIAILAAMLLPAHYGRGRARVPWCLSNLKQIDLGFSLYASDNQGRYPMQIPVANGGTMEFIHSEHTFPHFQKLETYKLEPKLFICPFETNRQAAVSYEALNDLNLSYFINCDASTKHPNNTILLGDRFLQANKQPVEPGLFLLTSNLNVSWTPGFHVNGGSFAFTDGHAEFSHNDRLSSLIQNELLPTNHFSIP